MTMSIQNKMFDGYERRRSRLRMTVFITWAALALLVFGVAAYEVSGNETLEEFYLVPSIIITGAIVLAPSIYFYKSGSFDPFHPLVFAAWSYIIPAFVFGGVLISFGIVDPYIMSMVDDPKSAIPLSLLYVGVGFLGLMLGYALPLGNKLALQCRRLEPHIAWDPSTNPAAGFVLFGAGVAVSVLGLIQGLVGFQRLAQIGAFDALVSHFLTLITEGSVALWIFAFAKKEKTAGYYLVFITLILTFPFRMVMFGNRASLFMAVLPAALAFQHSDRKLRMRHLGIFGTVMVLAAGIGMIYATSFRDVRGPDSTADVGGYFSQAGEATDRLFRKDPTAVFIEGLDNLASRIENLSSLAVVVSNYEKLAPFEASYGIENNIVNDALTSWVPRFVWPDKPETSSGRQYSALYFNYGDNSFAISPFGDLLRNFGPIGIPLGMILIGIYLRFIYVFFVQLANRRLWKIIAYLPLLTVVSYESFYALILPNLLRTAAVIFISVSIINLLVKFCRVSPRTM